MSNVVLVSPPHFLASALPASVSGVDLSVTTKQPSLFFSRHLTHANTTYTLYSMPTSSISLIISLKKWKTLPFPAPPSSLSLPAAPPAGAGPPAAAGAAVGWSPSAGPEPVVICRLDQQSENVHEAMQRLDYSQHENI